METLEDSYNNTFNPQDPWMHTHSGLLVNIRNPKIEDILIDDIAWSLSMQCRYAGHVKAYYSVAEHCIIVSRRLPEKLKLAGLLHDAAEAYVTDLPSPIKVLLPGYKEIENVFHAAVAEAFDVDLSDPRVKAADRETFFTEAGSPLLMLYPFTLYTNDTDICLYTQKEAYQVYIREFEQLRRKQRKRSGLE